MASNHNQLFLKLIKEIEKGDITGETIKAISRENLWKELLEFMKEEGGSDNLGHYPIFQNDFKADSLFKYINATADMDSNEAPAGTYDFKKILDNLKSITNPDGTANTGSGNNPWNESLTNSLTYFLRYIDPEYVADYEKSHNTAYTTDRDKETGCPLDVINTNGSIPVKGANLKGGFRIDDIKNANAGNSFSKTSIKPWVRPNYNIDGETYDKVRGIDKILKVLASHKEMQFTRTQDQSAAESIVNKYIRLLMPKYLRRVEVEDLNRNFWVIGQVIAAISAYLFDEDSPVVKTFKNILNELIQLWENVLYLWATAMLLSQKPYYTKVHTEVVYIPNDNYRDYSKFDNFTASRPSDLAGCWSRLKYLIDSYPECHLCIIPVIRGNNYFHNYYSKETWPGAILYNRNVEQTTFVTFGTSGAAVEIDLSNTSTYNKVIRDSIYAFKEKDDKYRYTFPFGDLSNIKESSPQNYYGMVRTIPTVSAHYNTTTNHIEIDSMIINIQDVGRSIAAGSSSSAEYCYKFEKSGGVWTSETGDNQGQGVPLTVGGNLSGSTVTVPSASSTPSERPITLGYYQGEVISYYGSTTKKQVEQKPIAQLKFKNIEVGNLTNETPIDYSLWGSKARSEISSNTEPTVGICYFKTKPWKEGGQTYYSGTWYAGLLFYFPDEEDSSKKYQYYSLGSKGIFYDLGDFDDYIYIKYSTDGDKTFKYVWGPDYDSLGVSGTRHMQSSQYIDIDGKYNADGTIKLTKVIIYKLDNYKVEYLNVTKKLALSDYEKNYFVKYTINTSNYDEEAKESTRTDKNWQGSKT